MKICHLKLLVAIQGLSSDKNSQPFMAPENIMLIDLLNDFSNVNSVES